MPDLNKVEAELRAILVTYEDVLETGEIYGMEVLRRPGAMAHDWFAGVQQVNDTVKLNLLPMHTYPGIMDGVLPQLLRHRTGASVMKFAVYDEALFAELEALVGRAFDAYMGKPSVSSSTRT